MRFISPCVIQRVSNSSGIASLLILTSVELKNYPEASSVFLVIYLLSHCMKNPKGVLAGLHDEGAKHSLAAPPHGARQQLLNIRLRQREVILVRGGSSDNRPRGHLRWRLPVQQLEGVAHFYHFSTEKKDTLFILKEINIA